MPVQTELLIKKLYSGKTQVTQQQKAFKTSAKLYVVQYAGCSSGKTQVNAAKHDTLCRLSQGNRGRLESRARHFK